MNQKDAIAVIKARGWRLRSKMGKRMDTMEDKPVRMWYVLNENGDVQVSPRYNRGVAIDWALVMITGDWERSKLLVIYEHEELWRGK